MGTGMISAMGDHHEVIPPLGDIGSSGKQRSKTQHQTGQGLHVDKFWLPSGQVNSEKKLPATQWVRKQSAPELQNTSPLATRSRISYAL
jgi:hypothetical protein